MNDTNLVNLQPQSESLENVLKALLESTSGKLGEPFIHSLGEQLCCVLPIDTLIIARWSNVDKTRLQTVAVCHEGKQGDNFTFELAGTFCENLIQHQTRCVIDSAKQQFPRDITLLELDAEGCLGICLHDSNHQVVGFLVAQTREPLQQISLLNNVLQIFSFRVAAEIERQRINQNLRNEVIINQTQLDSVPALMFMLDLKGQFLRWNSYFSIKFGYSHKEMKEQSIQMAIHETDRKRIELEIQQIFTIGRGSVYLNGVTKSGDIVPMLATAEATSYDGKPVLVGVALDMTEQQNVERNLLRSQGRLARKNSQLSLINSLVERLHTSHSTHHIAQEVVSVLRAIQRNCSIDFSVIGKDGETLEIISSHGISETLLKKRRRISTDEPGSPNSIALASKELKLFPTLSSDTEINEALKSLLLAEGIKGGLVLPLIYQNEVLGSVSIWYKFASEFEPDEIDFYQTVGSSISLALANARQYQLMESLATRDTLTGLPNRNALNQDCERELQRVQYTQAYVGLVLVDLDRFKEINDTLDHQIGDKLLRKVGPRLMLEIADSDARIYRLGGDEFCILVSGKRHSEDIDQIAQRIQQAIVRPFEVDGLKLEISCSVGVSTTHGVRNSASEMLRCAELAMYHIKAHGGGIAKYSPELDADTNERFVIMAEMAEAIRNNELVLHFQPKYDLQQKRIIGCEALVRWQHKKYGLLPPAKFIPQVELTQLIGPLTYWVLDKALAQYAKWQTEGVSVNIAINLSTRNLTDKGFLAQVDELINKYQVDPSHLEFEVTETAVMGNLEQATCQLQEFSRRGISCSLDDYGTGYSSLSYIKQLPLDILKIDRSFISQMAKDKQDRIIARSTINLAHSLGLKVVAEGVEDESTLSELAQQGCDFIQGYFISQPLDAESFTRLYWQKHRA